MSFVCPRAPVANNDRENTCWNSQHEGNLACGYNESVFKEQKKK